MHLQLHVPPQQGSEMQKAARAAVCSHERFGVYVAHTLSLDVHADIQLHRMLPARSFVTESQQLCAHILGLLQVIYAGWQLLHQTAPLSLPQRVVGLHTGMPLCCWADCLLA